MEKSKCSMSALKACVWMMGSALALSLSALLMKRLGGVLEESTLLQLRFLVPAVLLWCVVGFYGRPPWAKSLGLYFILRALFIVLGQAAFIDYIQNHSVLSATLLWMTGPLFMPLLSSCIYRTKIHLPIAVSLLIGFAGVACLLGLSLSMLNGALLIGLCAGFFNACSQLVFHRMAHQTSSYAINLYCYSLSAGMVALVLPFISTPQGRMGWVTLWHEPSLCWIVLVLALVGIATQIFRSWSYRSIKHAFYLAPLMYVAILCAAVWDIWFYHEYPTTIMYAGAALIVLSSVMVVRFNRNVK